MAVFYLNYADPVAQHYTREMLLTLGQKTNQDAQGNDKQAMALSPSEATRIMRALYRFQLFCQTILMLTHPNAIIELFVDALEPWEMEEFISFYLFAFTRIRRALSKDDSDSDERTSVIPSISVRRPSQASCLMGHTVLEGTTLLGLSNVHNVLSISDNNDDLRMRWTNTDADPYFFNGVYMYWPNHYDRGSLRPSKRQMKQEAGDALPFRGDGEPDAPPIAWTTIWEDTYSIIYGYCIPSGPRDWGYIFWDERRMESTGAMKVLMRDWRYMHEGWHPVAQLWCVRDPRNKLR
ncbi:hypothetical protein F5Y16DRAFT_273198 [Xylariaceae sp. FL0255]|nr:hypothetical protein F5Y16DRAFT_273198 [Xylariaceae sp. FL0255]